MTPVPYMRRTFTVAGPVVSARLYVTALGLYEMRLNGQKVGDAVLAPGWTDYSKRLPYQTFDVTELLGQGENVLGALIADGWYSGFVGFDAKRGAPTTAPHPSCWHNCCCGSPMAQSSGSSPTGSGRPSSPRSAMLTCSWGSAMISAWTRRAGTRPALTRRAGAACSAGRGMGGHSSPTRDHPSG